MAATAAAVTAAAACALDGDGPIGEDGWFETAPVKKISPGGQTGKAADL